MSGISNSRFPLMLLRYDELIVKHLILLALSLPSRLNTVAVVSLIIDS